MTTTSENNWYKWQYGNDRYFGRSKLKNRNFTTHFTSFDGPIQGLTQELKKVASSVVDHYPDLKPCVMFSGGVDSEVVIRSFLAIGIKPEVYIFRYENDYNIYDVSYAITVCSMLDLPYNLIDFNLKKFYENDAELVSELAQIDRSNALPQMKFMEQVDGLPIYGTSDITAFRINDDYSTKGEWRIKCWEHDIGGNKYAKKIKRPAVIEWFKWTPGLMIATTKTYWFKRLVNDYYKGKLGTNSTKIFGYRESFPDLIDRKKQTGFEYLEEVVAELEQHFAKKYNGLPFRNSCERTLDQLYQEILNKDFNYKI
jgi:hypothetical protein